jgi:hypothetical protein
LLIDTIKDYSNGLYEKNSNDQKDPIVRVITPSTSFDNYSGHTTSGTGKADDIVMVSLTYSWHLLTPFLKPFFPNGTYTFTVRTTMKNERGA